MDGKQVSGKRKRSSEILLHLSIMKARPDVRSCVHCHPPHATAFAVAHEPIPKCILPEFEVFLGEVAITPYETPGGQAFADTVLPYVKDTDTIILANHGTITYGSDLEDAYFKTEIIDAYCRILILAKQLGTGQLLLRREGRRADQAQAQPRHPRPPARPAASRTATSAATASSARATATSSPSPRRSSIPSSLEQRAARVADRGALDAARRRPPRAAAADMEPLVKLITDQVDATAMQRVGRRRLGGPSQTRSPIRASPAASERRRPRSRARRRSRIP